MTHISPPRLFDEKRIIRNRDRAAINYRQHAFLKARVSRQLLDRLADITRHFSRAVDLGAHDGHVTEALTGSDQVGAVMAVEPSGEMVKLMRAKGIDAHQGDFDHPDLHVASFDLVVSALALHWTNDVPGALGRIRTILKPDGLFLGCLPGAGTLTELRTVLGEVEHAITGGVSPRLSPLPGLQDMAHLLQRAGFAMPVCDVERVVVRYESPLRLLDDLKGMAEQAAFARFADGGPARRPLSRRMLARMCALYEQRFSDPDGKVRASFEIIWLCGWTPCSSQPKPLRPGSARTSLAAAIRRSQNGGAG